MVRDERVVFFEDDVLEALERDMQLSMAQMRRCRNDSPTLPISRLPPELLRMIFGYLRDPPSPHRWRNSTRTRFASYKPLIAAMLVCYKWHSIASQTASLWTDIDVVRQGCFASVLLSRSSAAPFRLRGRFTESTSDQNNSLEDIISIQRSRLLQLDLWGSSEAEVASPTRMHNLLAMDMPLLHILSLSCEPVDDVALPSTAFGASGKFPNLQAMLLENFLWVPSCGLPKLTHLHLAQVDSFTTRDVRDLLRSTPALEVLDITLSSGLTVAPGSTAPASPVALPCLHSVYVWSLTAAAVHELLSPLETPNLAFLDLEGIFTREGTALSIPLFPPSLASRIPDRLAFKLSGNFTAFRTAIHGNDISFKLDLRASGASQEARVSYAFDVLPRMLSLSGIEELHFKARDWDTTLLLHLASFMPMVSKLLIKHDAHRTEDARLEDVTEMGKLLGNLLEADDPVLFPKLTHLDIVVGVAPSDFCELISFGLEKRHKDGRRLQKLRIRLEDGDPFAYSLGKRTVPNLDQSGIRNHVDSARLHGARGIFDSPKGAEDDERPRWGIWKDIVTRPRHNYWE
ncbi:hypothetical protein BD310DRAFT_1043275 [Dichomitus squalens]|uniref:F-box domain-containing protein n=1 Tax=Dichomitus squalens TaxID=114155 RepID=A0A4Q9PFU1_9APHY|nr:hypothetical protein BD310DRAFT_1043275 [Dichomitus squalens]